MLIDHGQIFWSNHGGFNLAHAWRQAGIVPPTLVPEPAAPLAPGRWENLNTDAHTENSERWTRAVLRYAAAHPAGALTLALSRVSIYLLGPVPSEAMGIPPAALGLYRWAMAVGLVYLVVELVTGTALLISDRLPALRVWSLPGGLVVLIGSGSLVLQALGSAVEEARMVLALLPLVAALPGIGAGDYLEGRAIASARVGGGLILAAVFVLVLSIVWDPLRGVPFALSGRQLAAAAVATGLVLKGLILRSPGLDSS
jgi:hypothetical protein